MPIDGKRLLSYAVPEIVQDLTVRDTILYALSVGLGADPLDRDQLRFVYEDGLRALPTMAVVLGYPGFWLREPEPGVDWVKVVHGEQGIRIHKNLPVEGRIVGRTKLTGLVDKGEGKGALLYSERQVIDAAGDLVATLSQTTFLRGDGGCGGRRGGAGARSGVGRSVPRQAVRRGFRTGRSGPSCAICSRSLASGLMGMLVARAVSVCGTRRGPTA